MTTSKRVLNASLTTSLDHLEARTQRVSVTPPHGQGLATRAWQSACTSTTTLFFRFWSPCTTHGTPLDTSNATELHLSVCSLEPTSASSSQLHVVLAIARLDPLRNRIRNCRSRNRTAPAAVLMPPSIGAPGSTVVPMSRIKQIAFGLRNEILAHSHGQISQISHRRTTPGISQIHIEVEEPYQVFRTFPLCIVPPVGP